jgi:hypothetical protein
LRLRPSIRKRRLDEEISRYRSDRSCRPWPRATTPWSGRPASVPKISAVSRNAFPISEFGDEDPRESAKKRQKAPLFQSGLPTHRMPMHPSHGPVCVYPSVPARSADFHKPLLKWEIGDEHPPKPCQIVPNSATFSDRRNDPRPARTSSQPHELFALPIVTCLTTSEGDSEWVTTLAAVCGIANTEDSPDRSCGFHPPREVDYRTGAKQLGFETSGGSIGEEG